MLRVSRNTFLGLDILVLSLSLSLSFSLSLFLSLSLPSHDRATYEEVSLRDIIRLRYRLPKSRSVLRAFRQCHILENFLVRYSCSVESHSFEERGLEYWTLLQEAVYVQVQLLCIGVELGERCDFFSDRGKQLR